jgi:hypothetical protein
MPRAKNGADRGTCNKRMKHTGKCSNGTCTLCSVHLTAKNTSATEAVAGCGQCRECNRKRMRADYGHEPRNYQHPEGPHTFPCGCAGILPRRGDVNKFAIRREKYFVCRVLKIVQSSTDDAKYYGYKSIDPNTPHEIIRKLMEEPNCERCQQPLSWKEFGKGKTPHLHHDHESGEILGFTHPRCNPRAVQHEMDRLKNENAQLKTALRRAGIAA